MKNNIKSFHRLINASLFFSVFSSLAIILCFFAMKNETVNAIFKVVVPVIFWLGLIAEQVCIWKANSLRKQIESLPDYAKQSGRMGLISFKKTKEGFVFDILLALLLVAIVVCEIGSYGVRTYQFLIISLIVLSFRMHCILNGKNFQYKKYLSSRSKGYDNENQNQ